MRIVVIGFQGQLGSDLMRVLKGEGDVDLKGLSHRDIEITDYGQSLEVLKKLMPNIIINTAAYNRVDDAEDQYGLAFAVNAFGPRNLASISRELGATLVHISTDYVFDGSKASPYCESDSPNPVNTYGLSKLTGEYFVQMILDKSKYLIIRTSGLYGQAGRKSKGGNFVETMFKLAEKQDEIRVVNNQFCTPTYTLELAKTIVDLLELDRPDYSPRPKRIYHITNSGSCSWYEFAKKIFELANLNVKVVPVSSKEFKAKARRPAYSVLDNFNLKTYCALSYPSFWQKALKAYLEETGRIKMEG